MEKELKGRIINSLLLSYKRAVNLIDKSYTGTAHQTTQGTGYILRRYIELRDKHVRATLTHAEGTITLTTHLTKKGYVEVEIKNAYEVFLKDSLSVSMEEGECDKVTNWLRDNVNKVFSPNPEIDNANLVTA